VSALAITAKAPLGSGDNQPHLTESNRVLLVMVACAVLLLAKPKGVSKPCACPRCHVGPQLAWRCAIGTAAAGPVAASRQVPLLLPGAG